MARFIETPLSASTITFEYMSGSVIVPLVLDATNFQGGGGSGTTYVNGSGISIAGNVISIESTIYNKVTSLPAFGTTSTSFLANNGSWLEPYSAGTGLTLNASTFNHSNSITAGSVGNNASVLNSVTFVVPQISYNSTGHITSVSTTTVTIPTVSAGNVAMFSGILMSNPLSLTPGSWTGLTLTNANLGDIATAV